MKTNYIAHDETYKRRKAEGRPGWSDSETLAENLATLEEILQASYVPRNGKLLELGCGAGDLALWFAGKRYDAHGVDIAPTAIAWAQEKAKERNLEADFRVGNVLDLRDFADDYFEFVLDGHCFHCIIGDDRSLFLTSARRVLKPGGVFQVETMCGDPGNRDKELRKHFEPKSRCVIFDGVATRYLGLAEDILTEIKEAGFRILDWRVRPRRDKGNDIDTLLVSATNRWSP